MKPLRVLVTGARTYYSLAAIRQLGRLGHRITAADWDSHSTGFYSRYTKARWVYPRIDPGGARWVDALQDYLRREPHDVVLPMYEEALLLSKHAAAVSRLAYVPVGSYAAMLQLHDKQRLYELARGLGVPIPPTRLVDSTLPGDLRFPIVVKVGQSSSARGVTIVRERAAFPAAWHRLRASHALPPGVPAIVQDFVDGHQLCTLSFAWRGEPKGTVVYRNVCEFPPDGGAGIVRASIRHPAIVEAVARLIRANGSHGIVGFDFMVDRAGQPWLTDANPRPTPGLFLAQRCGLDLIDMAIGRQEPIAPCLIRTGLRTRIDPLVALWMLRSVFPGRDYWQRLATTFSLLVPRSSSASDFFCTDDLASLRALPAAAFAAVVARWRGARSLLDTVAASQYRDY